MYKRYYDGYGRNNNTRDRGEIVVPQSLPSPVEADENKVQITNLPQCEDTSECAKVQKSFLNLPFEIDDIILIGILLFLLFDKDKDDCDDDNNLFMLIIIGFIVFSDIFWYWQIFQINI